jgi:hypothetical protein
VNGMLNGYQKIWHSLTLKELYPIIVAIEVWGYRIANKSICFNCDNEALVYVLNKQSSTQALEFRSPFFLIWSFPRLWYGFLSGSISLSHLSIFYNILCYNSLVLLTFVSRSSCRFT